MIPELLELPPQPAVVLRMSVPLGNPGPASRASLSELSRRILAAGGRPAGPAFTRYIRFLEEGRLEVEAGFPVLDSIPIDPPAEAILLPGGPTASISHCGSYESLPAAHAALDDWLESSARSPAGPRWEVYLSDSSTRIFQPLETTAGESGQSGVVSTRRR